MGDRRKSHGTRGERNLTAPRTSTLTGLGTAVGIANAATFLNQTASSQLTAPHPRLTYLTATLLLIAGTTVGAGISLMVRARVQAISAGRRHGEATR